jgi:hypothetical protein
VPLLSSQESHGGKRGQGVTLNIERVLVEHRYRGRGAKTDPSFSSSP